MAVEMGFEAHFGLDASSTTSTEEYEFTALTQRTNRQILDAAGTRGTRSHVSERVKQGTLAPGYTVTLNPNSVELDSLLPRIFGGTESVDSFPLAETLPTFVTNIDNGDSRFHYAGCVVNRATFSAEQGRLLELTLDVEGTTLTKSATSFPSLTISTVAPYIFSEVVISVSSTNYSFKRWSLTIDNHLKVDRFYNSLTRASLTPMDRTITWEMDGPFGDNTALYALAAAGVACVATFTLGNRSVAFTSNKVTFPEELPVIPGRSDEITMPLRGVARKDGSTNELTCTNDSTG